MADGKTHAQATGAIFVASLAVAAATSFAGYPLEATGMVTGAALGHLVTPDIDQIGWTYCEARIKRYFGSTAANVWRTCTAFYAFTHKHRGWSHVPGVGTLGRWLFVGWPVFLLVWWLGLSIPLSFVLWAFVFHCLQDLAHLALDGFKVWI